MPLGLNAETRDRLAALETRRKRLYLLFLNYVALVLLFFLVVANVYSLEAVEAHLPELLSFLMELFLPGLPTAVLDFAERHPFAILIISLGAYLLRRASRKTAEAAQNCAFQAWIRTRTLGRRQIHGPSPQSPSLHWIPSPVISFSLTGVALALLLVNAISPQQPIRAPQNATLATCADGVRGDCWLRAGETVLVRVNAQRHRNGTGVLLERETCYAARLVDQAGWRDGFDIEPPPEGFEFDSDIFGIRKFWWMEWLRPRPEGLWFEIVAGLTENRRFFLCCTLSMRGAYTGLLRPTMASWCSMSTTSRLATIAASSR